MKTLLKIITIGVLMALPFTAMATETEKESTNKIHKVVFEVAMDGAEKWEGVLRNLENVQQSLGTKNTKIEVVAHGKGIGLILAATSAQNPDIKGKVEKLHRDGIVFAACENTMKRMKITKDQLVPLATTVDSGVTEVIRKQEAGYAYVKSGG